jgi:threonine dehydrogenase-like Zn-dependent dehydrogenase
VVTHTVPLEEAPRWYCEFNDKTDGCIKVLLKPGMASGAGSSSW